MVFICPLTAPTILPLSIRGGAYIDQIDDRYESMDKADRDSVWYKPTEKAKEYRAFEREMRNKMYSEIAARCEEYDRKHKNRDYER